eukprot:GFUD01016556.1.p1 GENE.GFUD01016556.1~~GFUD01016556.1.p1  ORF type:complete len:116 (+),score=35.67 GFUD01016556.1:56-403(+)
MRVLLLIAALLTILISISDAQKGGAKSAMRNRGKSGGRSSGARGGGGNRATEEAASGGRFSGAGGNSGKPRPCIGLCFLRKLNGEDPVAVKERAPPCIGLCFLKKLQVMKISKET